MKLGVKASADDIGDMLLLGPAFIETFIGRRDLDRGVEGLAAAFAAPGLPIVVHAPEYHHDDFVDLAVDDVALRGRSMDVIRMTVDLADELGARHIVLHPGGIAEGEVDRPACIRRLRGALEEISYERFYLENMPWFYFWAGDRRVRSNIMVDVADFEEVMDLIGGITVDTCHGFLSTEGGSMDYLLSFFDMLPGIPRYVHISDAAPPDGEGLQIGEGSIDWGPVLDRLRARGEDWLGIPEIMGGHEDGGAGFARALEILRKGGL